jgi:hypothetical protein
VVELLGTEDATAYAWCAARWWGDLLRAQVAPSLLRQAGYAREGGTSFMHGAMGDALAAMIREKDPPITLEQIEQLEVSLARRLVEQLARDEWVHFGVDYDPSPELAEAAAEAGLPRSGNLCFPYKTRMHIHRDKIEVSCGYGAPFVILFESKGNAVRRLLDERFEAISPWRDDRTTAPSDEEATAFWTAERRARRALERLPDYFPGPIAPIIDRAFAAKDVPPRWTLHYDRPGPMPEADVARVVAIPGLAVLNETARELLVEGGDVAPYPRQLQHVWERGELPGWTLIRLPLEAA